MPFSASLFQRTAGARTTPSATIPSTSAMSEDCSAIVIGADPVAVADAARLGVVLWHLQDGGLAVDRLAIAESRVHAVVVLRGNHFQGDTFAQRLRRRNAIRWADGNPRLPNSHFPDGVTKPPSAKGRKGDSGD